MPPSKRERAGGPRTPGSFRSSLLLLAVKFSASQDLERLGRFECILLRVVKCTKRFEILLLNLEIRRQRNRAEAIVAIRQLRSLAQFRQGVGIPRFNLNSLCFQYRGSLCNAFFDFALSHSQ